MAAQKLILSLLFLLLSSFLSAKEFNFKVLLNDKDIGHHRFSVEDQTINSDAAFDVKLWIIPAYKYRHKATETNLNGCLTSLQSETQDGADNFALKTIEATPNFKILVNQKEITHASCMQTFRYWDINFTQQKTAINPQDGKLFTLNFTHDGTEPINSLGKSIRANKYTLKALGDQDEKFHIELWYHPETQAWLQLKSYVKDDNVLTYVLQ
ncbi:MAG: DUF6134 family protein [Methylophilaceae bacterium]